MTNTSADPETKGKGKREDGRDLINEWTSKSKANEKWVYVWNEKQFQNLNINEVDHVLGMKIFKSLLSTASSLLSQSTFRCPAVSLAYICLTCILSTIYFRSTFLFLISYFLFLFCLLSF